MEPNPPPSRPHYTWPKYLLAALAAFLFVCIVWTYKEVNRLKRIKRESQDLGPAGLAVTNPPATNAPR